MIQSSLHGALFADAEIEALFSDAAEIAALIRVESALARCQGRLGVIPAAAAEEIERALDGFAPTPDALRAGTASAGVAVPALLATLRARIGGEAAERLHWGATSQDIIDSALVLRLGAALDAIAARLDALIDALAEQARRHARTPMAGRTRSQFATPITFGLRIAGWLAPLGRCRTRLAELRPRLRVVQFGGAAGALSALGGAGVAVMEALAAELDLAAPAKPWHAERDNPAELAGWLSLLTGALGKMGADLVLLARSEIAEARAGAGGGSSTMPQKSNPVSAEALVTLARFNAGQVGLAHQALVHAEERDGAAWSLEWLTLPPMMIAAGAAVSHGRALALALTADTERMRANLDLVGGACRAEAAVFALANHMPRRQAQELAARAARAARDDGADLVETLRGLTEAPVDWRSLADPAAHVSEAAALVERVLAELGYS